jgi:hypothetical protein
MGINKKVAEKNYRKRTGIPASRKLLLTFIKKLDADPSIRVYLVEKVVRK